MASSSSWTRRCKNFENKKNQCLGKRDKSFAGRIDVRAVDICSLINGRTEYYTTSSCSGRCFLYRGRGAKSINHDDAVSFERYRIAHDLVSDAMRYFDLTTLDTDPTGGADVLRTIGQYDHKEQRDGLKEDATNSEAIVSQENSLVPQLSLSNANGSSGVQTVWLRFEPFILHVSCRSLTAANALMAAARPAFKNVGLTSWKQNDNDSSSYLVAVWGDEGLDMPLCAPNGRFLYDNLQGWLQQLVNERHERNWAKIERFAQTVREMPSACVDENDMDSLVSMDESNGAAIPKSYDVIGDVALLHSTPAGDEHEREEVGKAILRKNKAIKICAARTNNLSGTERSPGDSGLVILAGPDRSPLVTTHAEYGIKCVVDLNHTFFSPRMGPERLRICQQVARGEHVLVLFAGVAMDAMQIAGRTEATSVVAIELNPIAVQCAERAQRMLERNKSVKCAGAAKRLQIVEGDVLQVLGSLNEKSFDRILAPRPKEGSLDGDLGEGDAGAPFLEALLPVLRERGECHWYDFASDQEVAGGCERTKRTIRNACDKMGLSVEFIHVASCGSIAKRQCRVCVDFRIVT